MPVIAFFPWIRLNAPVEIGAVRLLPYVRGQCPGNLPHASQEDIDAVLAAYATRPNVLIKYATVMEYGKWETGMDLSLEEAQDFYQAQRFIALAALSKRSLFRPNNFQYCNADTYSIVVQRYMQENPGTFAFNTRRRDGHAIHGWTANTFAFQMPHHVSPHMQFDVDMPLATQLLAAPLREENLREAIEEYLAANTDAGIPEYAEVVMMKSAFEWLFEIDEKMISFVNSLNQIVEDIQPKCLKSGPLKDRWEQRYTGKRMLEAWAREFCKVRGEAAHGNSGAKNLIWAPRTHLAFSSILFPLLLKKKLSAKYGNALEAEDLARLRLIDHYIEHDPFNFNASSDEEKDHPWQDLDLRSKVDAWVASPDNHWLFRATTGDQE